ncbi:hypothetical protein Vretimale_455 [Volvox reticuliferus]|uniref:Uncharacterized protein n=1 Tax=Volvox reticuliferus TaxID=1737510 RepID=A0A8J4D7P5_9CHLO|nr:hypothetical protein Vretifemale_2472 [Volvox reticuliferus]GIL94218.1 hypothetical protein Vretimale_455 [Volvox reticuliferus]
MLCRKVMGQAARTWSGVQMGRRGIPALIQRTSQQLPVPALILKPEHKACSSTPRAVTSSASERTYSDFHIYKTRAAMAVRLLPPIFTSENGYKTRNRDGVMLLEFASANPGQQPNGGPPPAGGINRTYNWANKVSFALSPVELGNILAGDAIGTEKGLVMFHDPAKTGKVGEPVKRLTLKQMQDGAISFSLNAGHDNVSVPVTKGEFEVLKSLAQFAIPRLMGFDAVFQ